MAWEFDKATIAGARPGGATATAESWAVANLGPFQSAAGDLYILLVDATNTNEAEMWKASADRTSWAEVDAAGAPVTADFSLTYSCVQDGDVVHIVSAVASGAIHYHTFDLSTDTWAIIDEATGATAGTGEVEVGIALRSDGDVIIVYDGARDSVMGTAYGRVDYARREGGTWTVDIALDGAGENHWNKPHCTAGASDRVHVGIFGSGYHRSIESDNTLGTLAVADGTTTSGNATHWDNYFDGTTHHIWAARWVSTGSFADPAVQYDTSAMNPGTMSVVTLATDFFDRPLFIKRYDHDGVNTWLAVTCDFAGNTNDFQHVWRSTDLATWENTTFPAESRGRDVQHQWGDIFDVGAAGKTLGMVEWDDTTLSWSEYELIADVVPLSGSADAASSAGYVFAEHVQALPSAFDTTATDGVAYAEGMHGPFFANDGSLYKPAKWSDVGSGVAMTKADSLGSPFVEVDVPEEGHNGPGTTGTFSFQGSSDYDSSRNSVWVAHKGTGTTNLRLWRFDCDTDTWDENILAPSSTTASHLWLFVCRDGNILVIEAGGGGSGLLQFRSYNPHTDTWNGPTTIASGNSYAIVYSAGASRALNGVHVMYQYDDASDNNYSEHRVCYTDGTVGTVTSQGTSNGQAGSNLYRDYIEWDPFSGDLFGYRFHGTTHHVVRFTDVETPTFTTIFNPTDSTAGFTLSDGLLRSHVTHNNDDADFAYGWKAYDLSDNSFVENHTWKDDDEIPAVLYGHGIGSQQHYNGRTYYVSYGYRYEVEPATNEQWVVIREIGRSPIVTLLGSASASSADTVGRLKGRIAPDAVLTATNVENDLAAVKDDPDSPDEDWALCLDADTAQVFHVSFPTPHEGITGSQEFRVLLRKNAEGGAGDPTVDIALYENGSLVRTLVTGTAITSATGQVVSATFDASELSGADGSGVECRITVTPAT